MYEFWFQIYDAEECIQSATACSICRKVKLGEKTHQLYDFTDEASAIFNSLKSMDRVGLRYLIDLYRGTAAQKRNQQEKVLGYDLKRSGHTYVYGTKKLRLVIHATHH